jgi:shikimate dehydrogenase
MAWPLEPEKLGDFVTAVRTLPITGVSVTIPHKQAVMEHLDGISDRARRVGAVNTLHWRDDRLLGENTDVTGFMDSIRHLETPQTALVLGAGGAARAAVAGLQELGVPTVLVSNRTAQRAESISRDLGCQTVPWDDRHTTEATLIVNATPLGMTGKHLDQSPYPADAFHPGVTAFDLIYNPEQTRFLQDAQAAGAETVGGLEMFVRQAAEQFHLWTTDHMDLEHARIVVRAALES